MLSVRWFLGEERGRAEFRVNPYGIREFWSPGIVRELLLVLLGKNGLFSL